MMPPYCPARVIWVFVLGGDTRPSLRSRRGRDERRDYARAGRPERPGAAPRLAGVSADTLARLELAYQEIQRRDSQAEHRAWRKERLVQRLGLVILVLRGARLAGARQAAGQSLCPDRAGDGRGALVQLGVPQALDAYTPPDGVYMEMVAQWVRWTRWRGTMSA